jgi:hypothetical protein
MSLKLLRIDHEGELVPPDAMSYHRCEHVEDITRRCVGKSDQESCKALLIAVLS